MKDLKKTRKNAIAAQCHECMGYYSDGREDCGNVTCSLYYWMPFRTSEPDFTWTKYHPKRKGLVLNSEIEVLPKDISHLHKAKRGAIEEDE